MRICDGLAHQIMTWDEDTYGREYVWMFLTSWRLMISTGAMENKGLNIFNSSYVLANPKTTMDGGFERIEGIIAHGIFLDRQSHHLSGLVSAEPEKGLTVFRDAQFIRHA